MIRMENVTKYYRTPLGRYYVFRNVTFEFPDSIKIGIIGPSGSGKTTLLRLLAGTDVPNEGTIIRQGSVSHQLGQTDRIQRALTGAQNVQFACRVRGLSSAEMQAKVAAVQSFVDLGKFYTLPVSTYSPSMRSRLKFALATAFDLDSYLFDELASTDDSSVSKKFREAFAAKRSSGHFIRCTDSMPELLTDCDAGVLLDQGKLTYFAKVEDAAQAYARIIAPDDGDLFARTLQKVERRKRRSEAQHGGVATEASQKDQKEKQNNRRHHKSDAVAADAPASVAPLDPAAPQEVDPAIARAQRRMERRGARRSGRERAHSRQEAPKEPVEARHLERPPTPHVPAPMAPRIISHKGGVH